MTKKNKVKKYKMKTHAGAKKRFTISGTGKIMRRRIGVNNFRRKKRGQTLRQFGDTMQVSEHFKKHLKRLLPYA